jgi:3-hydroxybutyryl-CoA dehydrogenase
MEETVETRLIAVIGAGAMGNGIAQVAATSGFRVNLDGAAPANALLLSNTSELSIAALASATNRRDRVAGMHWFNPPPLMKLIKIVRAEETSDETITAVEELSRRMGKETVVCRDARGFITSRALAAARGLAEAHGPRFSPPRLLMERVEKGHLGRKTGRGFYDHG